MIKMERDGCRCGIVDWFHCCKFRSNQEYKTPGENCPFIVMERQNQTIWELREEIELLNDKINKGDI